MSHSLFIRSFCFFCLLIATPFAGLVSDGDTINGVKFSKPWYAIETPDSSKTILLIDKDGDLYLGADSGNIFLYHSPKRDTLPSYILQNDTTDYFLANREKSMITGAIYTGSKIPQPTATDFVIKNVKGTHVALFDGLHGNLYVKGDAAQVVNYEITSRNYGDVFPDTVMSMVRGDTHQVAISAVADKRFIFNGWYAGGHKEQITIQDSSEEKTTVAIAGEGSVYARFTREPQKALKLSASDSQYVELPPIVIDAPKGFTLSGWLKVDSNQVDSATIIQLYQSEGESSLELKSDSAGFITLLLNDSSCKEPVELVSLDSMVVPNKWVHYTARLDGRTVALYRNGLLDTSVVATCRFDNTHFDRGFIGAQSSDTDTLSHYIDGIIDEIKMWDTPLSDSLIRAMQFVKPDSTHTGLIAWYSFNRTLGTLVPDKSVHANHGRMIHGIAKEHWSRSYAERVSRVTIFGDGSITPDGKFIKLALTQRVVLSAQPGRWHSFSHWHPKGWKLAMGDTTQSTTWLELERGGGVQVYFTPLYNWEVSDTIVSHTASVSDSLIYRTTVTQDSASVRITFDSKTPVEKVFLKLDSLRPMKKEVDEWGEWYGITLDTLMSDTILPISFTVQRSNNEEHTISSKAPIDVVFPLDNDQSIKKSQK
ncbi:MAG: LamG domain-containing protein [Fibrobacterales bacterium]